MDGVSGHFYDLPEGEDYMSIYETLDRVKKEGEGGAAGGARAEGQARAKTKEATALHEGKLQVNSPKKYYKNEELFITSLRFAFRRSPRGRATRWRPWRRRRRRSSRSSSQM